MKAARVLEQLVKNIKEGKISDDVAGRILEESNVRLTVGSKVGHYCGGMLKVGGANHSLDPLQVTNFSFPAEAPKVPESQDPTANVKEPAGREINVEAKSDLPFGDTVE